MKSPDRTPAQLRNMFSENLRKLSEGHNSISSLARQLGINRTQFNRYLSGESFPRPDVLARICDFFEVDARVLLEPFDQIRPGQDAISNPFLREFMGEKTQSVMEQEFPSGFYQFSRRSFVRETDFVQGLVYVHRDGMNTFIRGYEPKIAMAMQGIPPSARAREYRGYVFRVDDGVAFTVARRGGLTGSLNFLHRVSSFENNFWVGYVARTVQENMSSKRMTRLVYEHIPTDFSKVMRIARNSGYCRQDDLIPFHQRLLQSNDPFR